MAPVKRWKPSWDRGGAEALIGHAGALDVYYEDRRGDSFPSRIFVVGPPSRKKSARTFNFDAYDVINGTSIVPDANAHDVHVELSEMCEIYRLAAEAGAIKLEADDA
jgi:hypothetical protein